MAGVSLVAGLVLATGTVLAVHDETFQLDGDTAASTTTTVPPAGQPGSHTQTVDWDSIFDSAGADTNPLPANFKDTGFKADLKTGGTPAAPTFITSDNSTYATGSKDTLPISGWQCNQDNNVNSKIDVMNAYVVTYTNAGGDKIQYFALERNTNTGTADVGFWFLQDAVGCESPGGAVTFTGAHLDGDVLVVSEFSNGGTVSTINVYRWDRNNGNADCNLDPVGPNCVVNAANTPGSLRTTPIGAGVDCRNPNTPPGDSACAVSNTTANGTNGTITVPWQTANFKDGVGNKLRTSEFFEGGINLTDLKLGSKCFSSFIGDTRSSTSLTATLFDFAGGTSGSCGSGIVTTPQSGAGGTVATSIGTAARVDVRDHAVITVNGASAAFGGTVKFFLCGPLAAASTNNCSTGGVQIGTPLTGETVAGSAGTANLNSDTATLTSAGRYCWRAEYSGDATVGIPPSSDPSKSVADGGNVSECFTIAPVQPTLTTQASADVTLTNPITDTASLTGTAKQPGTDGVGPGGTINATAASQANAGGSITFTVKGPNNCTASGLTVTPASVTVNGDNASYGPVSATPTALGTYTFVAQYINPTTNTLGAGPSGCPPAAGEGDEEVTVTGTATLATAQRWLPNDSAHVTGPAGTTLSGNVVFKLFNDATCGAGTGTQQYTQTIDVTTGSGAANDKLVSTSNTNVLVTVLNDGTAWSWLVSYDDATLADPSNKCETTTPAFTLSD
jgi:hypothetical protein